MAGSGDQLHFKMSRLTESAGMLYVLLLCSSGSSLKASVRNRLSFAFRNSIKTRDNGTVA